jgi:antitoxin component of MazEF toxin-antitoxin module
MRDIVKVRKVGETLVVTLTQGVLSEIPLKEGDRVLIETVPPKRIIIMREEKSMPSTHRTQMEIDVLERKEHALTSEMEFVCAQNKLNIPMEAGMGESDLVELRLKQLNWECSKVAVELSEKRLELFELQGA